MFRRLKRRLILLFVPRIVWAILWILYACCKNRFHIHDDIYKSNAILAFWHGGLLMLPFLYKKMRQSPKIFVISSEHFDGELIAKLYGYYGFKAIRGSSSKSSRKVLLQAINQLKNGYDVAITPDGPKGPYHSIAHGIVAMAQKTNIGIVVVKVVPSKYWQLNTWDRFQIPKPFSTIHYYSMPSFQVDKDLSLDSAKALIYEKMTI